jgi:hypothetical protein
VRKQGAHKIYAVDGAWIRNNLCFYFGHGGHGLVHEFIPVDEIWVSTRHYHEGRSSITRCGCLTRSKTQKVSEAYFKSTVIHEIKEYEQMKAGKRFWVAHQAALKKEQQVGLLSDPYIDR